MSSSGWDFEVLASSGDVRKKGWYKTLTKVPDRDRNGW